MSCQSYWHNIREALNRQPSSTFLKMIKHIMPICDFWREQIVIGAARDGYIKGIESLANCYDHWIRNIEDWKPVSHNSRKQFSSLARHLLAKYDVPSFMDWVWFDQSKRYHEWFWHIGQGGNIRTLDTPIPVTKKIAHHFMQAPDGYSIVKALRYGQIIAMGGDTHLAETINATQLGQSFDHDDFWSTVVVYFINNPMFDRRQVGPAIDYLRERRFVGMPPAEPNLSMKGRDPNVMMKRIEAWHHQLARAAKVPRSAGFKPVWKSSGIKPFVLENGVQGRNSYKKWLIEEITSYDKLVSEGKEMSHCVASYASSCSTGRCSIWSMKIKDNIGLTKQLTVEVSKEKVIIQARGKRNIPPNQEQMHILSRWAESAGLTSWIR